MSYKRLIKERHLITLWISQVLSCVGDQLYGIASVWIAVQQGGPKAGFVAASGSIAGFCLGLFGGVYADRWNRRTTMIVVDVLRAAVVLALAISAHFTPLTLWQLGLASACVASLGSLFEPSIQASIPELTKKSGTRQAMNALMLVNHRLARTIGPGVAGLLVAMMPIHHFFTLDAITFGISAIAIASLGRHYNWKSSVMPAKQGVSGVIHDIASAARLVRGHQELVWTLGIYIASNIAWHAGFIVGFALWAKQVLHSDVGTFGTLIACYGVGSVLSNIVMGTVTSRRRMFFVSFSEVIFGIGFCIVALANNLPLACFGAALAATGGPMGDIFLVAMIQEDMPREFIGKVYSLRMFIANFGAAVGLLSAPALLAR